MSVVMPVYNGQVFLAQAIESVLAQTHRSVEILAVDDGSTDGSAKILASYGSRIHVIRQENAGVAAARNVGIKHAAGEYVAFLDQDDWWLPEKAAVQVELFRRQKGVGLVHTDVIYYDQTIHAEVGPENPNVRPDLVTGDCYELLLLGNMINNSSVMVRRHVLDDLGGLDEQIRGNTVQDYDLWLRIAKNYHIAYAAEQLTVFRLHAGQGHWDLRAMLSEELAMLLRHRPLKGWRNSGACRRRLANLHDSLATAYFEAGEARLARRYFGKAVQIEPSPRRLGRFGASCFPYTAVAAVRRAWHQWKEIPQGSGAAVQSRQAVLASVEAEIVCHHASRPQTDKAAGCQPLIAYQPPIQ